MLSIDFSLKLVTHSSSNHSKSNSNQFNIIKMDYLNVYKNNHQGIIFNILR